ncbi:MAG: hypothetical protein ABJE47_22320 [bacterium]
MTLRYQLRMCGLVALAAIAGAQHQSCRAQGTTGPTTGPRLFAPGVISGAADELSPAFSPDGRSVYFTRGNPSASTIMTSTLVDGHWSVPEIAAFSGKWNDFEASMAPDGSFLVFASNRPSVGTSAAIDGVFNGKSFPGLGGNLWRVDRLGNGWGEPTRLPETINVSNAVFSPSISADGSIYFMRPDDKTGNFHLYRSQRQAGAYLAATAVGVGDSTTEDVDAAVAPDESFMVYSSNHPGKGPKRLHIVFGTRGVWGTPVDLGDDVNEAGSNIEARLSPDHRLLYFSTNTVPPVSFPRSVERTRRDLSELQVWANGRQNIWFVSLEHWLDKK